MLDSRFYEPLGPLTAGDLAGRLPVRGDPARPIHAPAPFAAAAEGDLSYMEKATAQAASLARGVVIATEAGADLIGEGATVIVSPAPRADFARLAPLLARPRTFGDGPEPQIELSAHVHPTAVIGPGAEIGAGAEIGPLAVIGPGVAIGRHTRVGARATVLFALVGDEAKILSGAVIGETGFGVAGDARGLVDVPHFGRVIVQDRVVIGANTTVDRGMLDDTVIGEASKIDNLCQIAHNVRIGRGVVMAAYAGISGSVVIEDGARLGGRVGIADHVTIGRGASLAAGSAVMHDVPAGETWGGYPAKPSRAWMRELAWLKKNTGRKDG